MFKKLLFVLLFLPFIAKAQVKTKLFVSGPLATNVYRGPLGSDSALYIMAGCDSPATINVTGFYSVYRGALIYKDTCNDAIYTSNPDASWTRIINSSGDIYIDGDTIVINNIKVVNKLRIPLTDTTNARKGCGNIIYDTINEHYYGDVCINGVHYAWQCFDCISGSGTISEITATNNYAQTWTITSPNGPTTNLSLVLDTTLLSTRANVDSKTITLTQGSNISITGNATQNLGQNPSWTINATGFGTGTVTSVGLAAPTIFTVSGSPVTTSGTLTFSPNNAQGDIIYGSAANTLSYLPKSTTLGHVLTNTGTDNNPAWDFPIILTTTGTSGAATYTGRTLNIPQYQGAGLAWLLASGGTMTGQNTLTSNTVNSYIWNGAFTATAQGNYEHLINPTLTTRSNAGDTIYGVRIFPIWSYQNTTGTQYGVALDLNAINSTGNAGGGQRTNFALQLTGNVNWGGATNTYNMGSSSQYAASTFSAIVSSDSYRSLANSYNSFASSSGVTTMRQYTNQAGPGIMVGTSSQVATTGNNFVIESRGEMKAFGGLTVAALATPPQPTVVASGTTGSTTMTYKIVARLVNGTTTEASASQTITNANATLSGTNRVTITWTEVVGAILYDVYLTATTGSATLGKIGTYTSLGTFGGSLAHTNNAAGDGSTPPTVNTTGSLGVGTTAPTSMNQLLGSFALGYVAKSGTYTATAADQTIDCTSGTFTVTLPTAVGCQGRIYTVVNSGAGTITIGTTSSQTFVNINAAPTTLTLGAVGAGAITAYTVMSNNANWIVTGKVKNE